MKILFLAMMVMMFESCTRTAVKNVDVPFLVVKRSELIVLLDSLVNRERNCGYNDEDLIWTVSFRKTKENDTNMVVTKTRGFPKAYGCFYLKETLVVVDGEFVRSLFDKSKELKRFQLQIERDIPSPETFSTWVYRYMGDDLLLENAWPFPCKK